jgi:hypothetical protein
MLMGHTVSNYARDIVFVPMTCLWQKKKILVDLGNAVFACFGYDSFSTTSIWH